MAQSIATLQAAEQQLSQKLSSPPPSKPAHAPPPKPLVTPTQQNLLCGDGASAMTVLIRKNWIK